VILAAEDVGLANPQALPLAVAAYQAVHFIGMPEGHFPLTEATLYLALSPKSNSTLRTYGAAMDDVQQHGALPVPLHLRNAVTGLMRGMGYGRGYRYAHDFADARVEQAHLPQQLDGKRYYTPGKHGAEPRIAGWLERGPGSSSGAEA
jgi:putative ATPase